MQWKFAIVQTIQPFQYLSEGVCGDHELIMLSFCFYIQKMMTRCILLTFSSIPAEVTTLLPYTYCFNDVLFQELTSQGWACPGLDWITSTRIPSAPGTCLKKQSKSITELAYPLLHTSLHSFLYMCTYVLFRCGVILIICSVRVIRSLITHN